MALGASGGRWLRWGTALVDGLLRAFYEVGYYIEHLSVMALEAVERMRQRLDPRLYRETRRVRTVTEGRLTKDTARFVVLVLYTRGDVPGFTRTFIEALRRSRFNLVIVSNGELAPSAISNLLDRCCMLIERENVGQDFGGYKDGISILRRRGRIERLVLANDSVFYLPSGLDKLIADLDRDDDVIGVSETCDHHYHVASFLMSFGSRVVESTAFRQFWARYRPIGTRRWAIFHGEGALTAMLLRAGFRPCVLFRAADIGVRLRGCAPDEAATASSLLPPRSRRRVKAQMETADAPALADSVVAAIMAGNQMHAGGFLFRRYFGLPLVKRDILYRDIYPLDDISDVLADVEPALRGEILGDIERRGSINGLGAYRRILSRHSAA